VRSALSPTNRIACSTPAGTQTAQVGGAIQEPAVVRTLISPDRT
jgi:hypothetical protein